MRIRFQTPFDYIIGVATGAGPLILAGLPCELGKTVEKFRGRVDSVIEKNA